MIKRKKKRPSGIDPTTVAREFEGIELGDERLETRAKEIVALLAAAPNLSLPSAMGSLANTEALYRFTSNERFDADDLLAGHYAATVERAASEDRQVLCIHDTTVVECDGREREGLGPVPGSTQGYLAHVSLLVADAGALERERCPAAIRPLGVANVHTWTRPATRPKTRGLLESRRWRDASAKVIERVDGRTSLLHVADREADIYDLMGFLHEKGQRFVIRAIVSRRRKVRAKGATQDQPLQELLEPLKGRFTRTVFLSKRAPSTIPDRTHAPRPARKATLEFCATTVRHTRPRDADKSLPATLDLNVVHVREVDTPENQTPVEWTLFTTEPIRTQADVEAVAEWYVARWLVEEFFKALKTGCQLESRQLESYSALTKILALSIPIAWQLLLLRHVAHVSPDTPASSVLSDVQINVLRARKPRLGPTPTVKQALYAVAELGGHLPQNGAPGWLTLGRGFEKLTALATGWSLREAFDEM